MDTDRAWPDDRGRPPGHGNDPGEQLMHGFFGRAVDQGRDPADLADLVVDAIHTRRFLVSTHLDDCARAVDLTRRVVDGAPPEVLDL